jgi:hypothetical protein
MLMMMMTLTNNNNNINNSKNKNIDNKMANQLNYFSLSANRKRVSKMCKSLVRYNGAQNIASIINTLQ